MLIYLLARLLSVFSSRIQNQWGHLLACVSLKRQCQAQYLRTISLYKTPQEILWNKLKNTETSKSNMKRFLRKRWGKMKADYDKHSLVKVNIKNLLFTPLRLLIKMPNCTGSFITHLESTICSSPLFFLPFLSQFLIHDKCSPNP